MFFSNDLKRVESLLTIFLKILSSLEVIVIEVAVAGIDLEENFHLNQDVKYYSTRGKKQTRS